MTHKKCPAGKVWENSRCVRKKNHWVRNGAVLGGIWGIISIIILTTVSHMNSLLMLLILPVWVASFIVGRFAHESFLLVWLTTPLIGVLLGALVGYIIKKVKYG